MGKTENMLLRNKEANAAKVATAVHCIKDMLKNEEQVVVCELVKRTGLSRTFFIIMKQFARNLRKHKNYKMANLL